MCYKLREVMATIKESDEPMTKRETIKTFNAIGLDMERQGKKIEALEQKIDNVSITQNSILKTQTSILSMIEKINKKLDDDKIEEKAFAYEQNQKIIHNWKFWVVVIPLAMLAGAGVLKVLDKSDNIKTISEAIKK